MPYILELIDDEEEVLIALCETLSTLLDSAGGPQQAEHLLKPLEKLCSVEETSVREKATESIKIILSQIRIKDFENCIMSMLLRLEGGDSFTSKFAAVKMIPSVYS